MGFRAILLTFIFAVSAQAHPQSICSLTWGEEHNSLSIAKQLVDARGQNLKKEVLFDSPIHGETVEVSGVPAAAQLWKHDSQFVFRHYFTNSQRLPAVVKNSLLDAEVEPYYIVHPHIRKEIYVDLVGTFLTTPEMDPRRVGLEPGLDYVDFTLPAGLGVIFLEEGIWLIPGKPAVPGWIQAEYLKFKQSGSLEPPAGYEKAFQRLARYETMPELLVPIQIRSFSVSGKTTHLNPK